MAIISQFWKHSSLNWSFYKILKSSCNWWGFNGIWINIKLLILFLVGKKIKIRPSPSLPPGLPVGGKNHAQKIKYIHTFAPAR